MADPAPSRTRKPLHPPSADEKHPHQARAATTYRDHRRRVYRYLLRKTNDHYEAEELTQRVFVDAAAAMANADFQPDSILGWLFTVADRRLVDELRRRRHAAAIAREVARSYATAEQPYYGTAVADALRTAIGALPPEQRSVVVMKILEGRRFAEIAAKLGSTEGACKMRFSRAIRTLRARLNDEGLGR